jgi:hypothetical protein
MDAGQTHLNFSGLRDYQLDPFWPVWQTNPDWYIAAGVRTPLFHMPPDDKWSTSQPFPANSQVSEELPAA